MSSGLMSSVMLFYLILAAGVQFYNPCYCIQMAGVHLICMTIILNASVTHREAPNMPA